RRADRAPAGGTRDTMSWVRGPARGLRGRKTAPAACSWPLDCSECVRLTRFPKSSYRSPITTARDQVARRNNQFEHFGQPCLVQWVVADTRSPGQRASNAVKRPKGAHHGTRQIERD